MVEFNNKLQDQKYDGLKRRVTDQSTQLQKIKPDEKLDDPNLWNDYVQFMGELGNRIHSSLPYKYEDNLTNDPDVADFVRALMTYCQAYGCFNTLLITAKGKFADLGSKCKEHEEEVDRKISGQIKDLKVKLAFLFDNNYLTFLGRLPSEGGKLTKIVALSRNQEARRIVEMTTRGFGFTKLLDYNTIESKAEIVSRQSVKLKVEGHPRFTSNDTHWLQFINETQYPLKVIGGTAPKGKHVQFTHVLQPQTSFFADSVEGLRNPLGGYVIIYIDGELRPDDEPHSADVTRIIEFALNSGSFGRAGVNIQDKTSSEFTKGQDTYDKMKNEETKSIYWKTKGVHYMARAEMYTTTIPGAMPAFTYDWCFVFQDFDPFRDIVTAPPKGRV